MKSLPCSKGEASYFLCAGKESTQRNPPRGRGFEFPFPLETPSQRPRGAAPPIGFPRSLEVKLAGASQSLPCAKGGKCLRRPHFFARTKKWGKESRQGSWALAKKAVTALPSRLFCAPTPGTPGRLRRPLPLRGEPPESSAKRVSGGKGRRRKRICSFRPFGRKRNGAPFF